MKVAMPMADEPDKDKAMQFKRQVRPMERCSVGWSQQMCRAEMHRWCSVCVLC